jgi:hypothetical protein
MDEVSAELWCKGHVFLEVEGDTVSMLDVEALVVEIERCQREGLIIRGEALLDVLRRIHAQLSEREEYRAMAIHGRVLALLEESA